MLPLLTELPKQTGGAMLLATHDPASAAAADRVVRMRDGLEVRDIDVTVDGAVAPSS